MSITIHPAIAVLLIVATVAVAALRRPTAAPPAKQVRRRRYAKPPTMTEGRFVNARGYVMVKDPAHPLSRRSGYVLEHRKSLHDAIGPGPHQCAWCGTGVVWGGKGGDALVVDHFDGDKQNNDPANLRPSCVPCNAARSAPMVDVEPSDESADERRRRLARNRAARYRARKAVQ
jgi:hypothetical protein